MFSGKNYNIFSNNVFNVGIYARISRDDEEKTNGKSESIQNQINFLTKFVVDNEWNLVSIYFDDGYTGTNFDRPDFIRLIKDIENKTINMVVTKDLSRLGRDYIETGRYMEKYFPSQNVRYIAVNDGIDTFANSSNNDMSPFKSVINDMYARDISKKVKSVMDNKRINGDFIGSFAPYGYIKDPSNKSKLIVDEETAYTVKRVFDMYMQGHGYSYIANILNMEGIPSPSAYKEERTNYKNAKSIYKLWAHQTIKKILTNPTYKGDVAQRKYSKINHKIKQLVSVPKSNWIIVSDTHQPIVDKDSFDIIQKMIGMNDAKEFSEKKYPHLLSGILYCGDCGSKMTFFKTSSGLMYVLCGLYKRNTKLGLCTRHSMLEKDVEAQVIDNLKNISNKALNVEKIEKLVQNSPSKDKGIDVQTEKKRIEVRLEGIKRTIRSLYEDKLKGVITENDFINLSQDYNREREQITIRLNSINEKEIKNEQLNDVSQELMKIVKDLINFENIDKKVFKHLIEKIEIFENKKIKIHYKFRNPY